MCLLQLIKQQDTHVLICIGKHQPSDLTIPLSAIRINVNLREILTHPVRKVRMNRIFLDAFDQKILQIRAIDTDDLGCIQANTVPACLNHVLHRRNIRINHQILDVIVRCDLSHQHPLHVTDNLTAHASKSDHKQITVVSLLVIQLLEDADVF